MSGKTRPSQRAKVLSNVDYSDLSHTDKKFIHDMFALVEKQQAEIERLTINMNAFGLGMKQEKERADTIRAEAIKEFADIFVEKIIILFNMNYSQAETAREYKKIIVNEMAGDTE
jgi:hypothetical protein